MENTFEIKKNHFDYLKQFEYYLREKCLKEGSIKKYIRIILSYLEDGYTYNDLLGMIIDIVYSCFNGQQCFDPKDHGNTRAAFFHYIEFILEQEGYGHIYISRTSGWSSFVPKGKHQTGYEIDGDNVSEIYNAGFMFCKLESKKINRLNYIVLRLFFRNKEKYLSPSNNAITTIHGPLESYSYFIKGIQGNNCRAIFTSKSLSDDNYVKILNEDYQDLIKKII